MQGCVVAHRVVVKNGGWIQGSLTCRSLTIEEGGLVDAQVEVVETGILMKPTQAEASSLPDASGRILLADNFSPKNEA